jgi:hypothetical protein
MSITDSTTTLDTSWTGQSFATFTTGVLSTLATCVSEVESKLQRGTLSTSTIPTLLQVQNWLRRAKLELVEEKGFSFARKYAYCDLTANSYRYSLPPDYNGGAISLRDMTNDRDITVYPSSRYDNKYPDPSAETSDQVLAACVKNMELWVIPPPNGSDRLELEYARSGAETTADDFSWLPELERFRCCDFALYQAFQALHQWEVSQLFKNEWDIGLKKSRRADGRRKWTGRRLTAINVFQEYAAKNYQP